MLTTLVDHKIVGSEKAHLDPLATGDCLEVVNFEMSVRGAGSWEQLKAGAS